jgi:hypothetical protein
MKQLRVRVDRELVLLVLLSLFALAPLFSPGYFFDAHDADHSVFFLVEFDSAIRDGALWPRWGPDHALGYGYPLWLLYAPLAYYVAEGFHLLGLGFTAAVKATWAVGFLFGGWGMYALLHRWWAAPMLSRPPNRPSTSRRLARAGRAIAPAVALVGGLAYVYAPYHLLNIYVRAALAEFCALAWFPWVLLAFDDLVERGGLKRIALAALAFAGLLLTHTATILIFTPLLAAYLIFAVLRRAYRSGLRPLIYAVQDAGDSRETLTALGLSSPLRIAWAELWQTSLRVLAGGLLAAGLAAIFLLPMLAEQRYIVESQWVQGSYGYRQHFVYPSQLLDPFWGYGFSDDPTGPNDGLSFQLGIVGVGLALTAVATGLRRRSLNRSTTAFFLLATVATLLLMMPFSEAIWDAVGPAELIQFPWRLLGVAVFGLVILGGAAVGNLLLLVAGAGSAVARRDQVPVAYVLALVVVLASLAFTQPQYTDIQPVDESPQAIVRFETTYPDMIGITAYAQQAPTDSPLVAQYRAGEPLQKATLLAGSGQVETLRVGGASVVASVDAAGPATVLFYTYDFPGWHATLDGQPIDHRAEPPYGLIAVDVPAGQHQVAIRHGTTPVRTAGTAISLVSLATVIVLFWLDSRRRTNSQGTLPNRQ